MDTTINYIKSVWAHQGFQKYFRNTGWMLIAKIFSFVTSFFTIAIVARYLGPSNLGKLEYAQSFVAILSVIASLGIDQILYRDLIKNPEKENELIGTAIYAKIFFGIIAFLISIIASVLIGNETTLTIIIGISASTFLINPLGTISISFNAKVKSKYSSIISIVLSIIVPILKLLIVFLDKGIIYFSLIFLLEAFISVIWILFIYIRIFNHDPRKWNFKFNIFKILMKDSWPLLLASFSGYVYAKMDQILLQHYIDSSAVGIYGAAVKITQIWAFLPGLIIGSLFPAIINAQKNNFSGYAKRFKNLTLLTTGITLIIVIPLFIFSKETIQIIFGENFIEAVPILKIYLWISLVINLVVLSQNFLIAENLSKIFLYSSLLGASTNIIANIILIPQFGSVGSAWGTMFSYIVVVLSLFLFKESRKRIFGLIKKKP